MRTLLNQQALDFLNVHNIPVLNYTPIDSSSRISSSQHPFFLKVDSPAIVHKSERRGVYRVHHPSRAVDSFNKLRKHGKVIRQPLIEGHEFVIQLLRTPKGKTSLIVGFGGVSTDIHNDFSIRMCPISLGSARKMIEELRTFHHVNTFRSKDTRFDILEETIVKLSDLVRKENVKSLEIDPFILNHRTGRVVDAKITLGK